jgi:hypothetical protein
LYLSCRAELYKNYLMYSMSGDVVELPVGGVIRKKSSLVTRQAEMNRLQQLGDILGMSPLEVNAVHTDLAEQAYKSQVGSAFVGVLDYNGLSRGCYVPLWFCVVVV